MDQLRTEVESLLSESQKVLLQAQEESLLVTSHYELFICNFSYSDPIFHPDDSSFRTALSKVIKDAC